MRIETNTPNASNFIGGIWFAKVADGVREDHEQKLVDHKRQEPDDKRSNEWRWWNNERLILAGNVENPPPWLLSEEIDEKKAAGLLGLPGFRRANRTAEECANVDELLGSIRQGAVGVAASDKDRTIGELQAANQAMALDLDTERRRRIEVEKSLAQSKLPPSEVARELTAEVKKLQGDLAARDKTISELRDMNANLGKQIAAPRPATPAAAKVKAPPRRKRKRRRVVRQDAHAPSAEAIAAAAPGV